MVETKLWWIGLLLSYPMIIWTILNLTIPNIFIKLFIFLLIFLITGWVGLVLMIISLIKDIKMFRKRKRIHIKYGRELEKLYEKSMGKSKEAKQIIRNWIMEIEAIKYGEKKK